MTFDEISKLSLREFVKAVIDDKITELTFTNWKKDMKRDGYCLGYDDGYNAKSESDENS